MSRKKKTHGHCKYACGKVDPCLSGEPHLVLRDNVENMAAAQLNCLAEKSMRICRRQAQGFRQPGIPRLQEQHLQLALCQHLSR